MGLFILVIIIMFNTISSVHFNSRLNNSLKQNRGGQVFIPFTKDFCLKTTTNVSVTE